MTPRTLEEVAAAVVRRAQRQTFVVARDVRSELKLADLEEDRWKDVLALAKPSLHYRQGRYYPVTTVSPRLQKEQDQQRAIQKVIRQIIKEHKQAAKDEERRGQARVDFIQPVKVITEDGKAHALLSRDISPTGIRLFGTKRLLGHKAKVEIPLGEDSPPCCLLVRILWTCAVGDELFENGAMFVSLG